MKILVTGGLGYVGSHTVVELQHAGFEVIVIDNLSNSSVDVLRGIATITGTTPRFEQLDLREKDKLEAFFKKHNDIAGVIHFAALKAVGESVKTPLQYYENNVNTMVDLLRELLNNEIRNFIFSSSCTVYGEPTELPLTEDSPLNAPASPYGHTKQIGERILHDTCTANPGFNAIALRYFNPIGAHESAGIGELPIGTPQNLVPVITQTAIGLRPHFSVFGDDYPTPDGSCIRDYIHIADVAKAHVTALKRLLGKSKHSNYEVFNLGTGKGTSVLEVIRSFEHISGQKLRYTITERRPGDVTAAYAATEKANTVLGWKTQYTLEEALASAWKWEQKIRQKIIPK